MNITVTALGGINSRRAQKSSYPTTVAVREFGGINSPLAMIAVAEWDSFESS